MIAKSGYRALGDGMGGAKNRSRSHPSGEDGVFEQDFETFPAGPVGMNRLAMELNELQQSGMIENWSCTRWKNVEKTVLGIRFASAQELDAARLIIRT
jgi:hypothetical protein